MDTEVVKSIVALIRKVSAPTQPAVRTSEKYFKGAGVRLMGDNFKTQFLGLKVNATDAAELAVRRLEEASLDASILAELGDKVEILVSQFRAFLDANRESKEWFIFYLKGKNGSFWAVDAYWGVGSGGWLVDARSVTLPLRWIQGYRVVSQV